MVYVLPVDSCLVFVAFLEPEIQPASLLAADHHCNVWNQWVPARVLLNLGYVSSRWLV